MSDKDREFVTRFIEIYRNNPSLWNTKGKSYNDKNIKLKAYTKLLELYKTINERATINTVRKKINNLRCSFRKELNKTRSKNLCGLKYTPSLWYYDLLLFTKDQKLPKVEIGNDDEYDGNDESENSEQQDVKVNADEMSPIPNILTLENNYTKSPSRTPSIISTLSHTSLHSENSPEALDTSNRDNLLRILQQQLEIKEDPFEITGKYIANKLRSLPKQVAIFAEKLLIDVLFEAQLGTLNRNSKIVI